MDVWEANSRSNQIAPHTCGKESLFTCSGDECGSTAAGVCDKIGCGDNPYLHRNDKSYYGPGLKVDTSKPFTVVTQFPAKDGVLQAIVRKYVQNGVVIENTSVNVTMDQEFCDAQSGASQFNALGGLKGMGDALARGMVLAFSIWWDESGFMNWLDAGSAGPCNATEGDPKVIQQIEKAPTVTFSQIKWGEIGSTFGGPAQNGTMYKWRA
jgi:cellulase